MKQRSLSTAVLCCLAPWSLAIAQNCQEERTTPSTFRPADHFGRALSLQGNVLAVGASEFDGAASDSGAVFIFRLGNGQWAQTAIIEPSDPRQNGRFGESVCLDGDTLAIGAFGDTDKGLKAGAVYIFNHDQEQWIENTKLTADDTTTGDRFGTSLAIIDDLLVVGAPYSDAAALNAGAAYTFRLMGNKWTQESRLDGENPQELDLFGHAVDTDYQRILVSAYLDDDQGEDSGSATVFSYHKGQWQKQALLLPPPASNKDWFGHNQVAINGNNIVIGALGDDDRSANSGCAYIYVFTGMKWEQTQKLAPAQLNKSDNFGKSLAFDDDMLLIGARFDDTVATNGGAAYLFSHVGDDWQLESILTVPTALPYGEFGRGIAVGDGNFAIGAHRHPYQGMAETGAAWVYNLAQCNSCAPDCDQTTGVGTLDVFDFLCFQNAFVNAQPYACDCDTSTGLAVCDVFDFLCFQSAFVVGCQ